MNSLTEKYTQPKSFWAMIKKLKGSNTSQKSYLIKNNKKLMEDQEKAEAHTEIWKNIFKIILEESARYDLYKEKEINDYLATNANHTILYNTSWLESLQGLQEIDILITFKEIKDIIKTFKKNTPGETHVNKLILTNLPDIPILALQSVFNNALSMGYFSRQI